MITTIANVLGIWAGLGLLLGGVSFEIVTDFNWKQWAFFCFLFGPVFWVIYLVIATFILLGDKE